MLELCLVTTYMWGELSAQARSKGVDIFVLGTVGLSKRTSPPLRILCLVSFFLKLTWAPAQGSPLVHLFRNMLRMQMLTYTRIHPPLWTHTRTPYPYEHLRKTEPADWVFKLTKFPEVSRCRWEHRLPLNQYFVFMRQTKPGDTTTTSSVIACIEPVSLCHGFSVRCHRRRVKFASQRFWHCCHVLESESWRTCM
jgi:hypothetical protein